MKKPAFLSLSLLTLSVLMAIESPVCAATRTHVPGALASNPITNNSSTSETADGIVKNIYAIAKNDQVKKSNIKAENSVESDILADDNISTENTSDINDTSVTENASDDSLVDAADENESIAPFVVPDKLNNKAKDVTPYQLYSLNGKASDLSISGKATTNYKLIKDKLTDKYTMMVYLCGTDLEDDNYTLTTSICRIMQAAPKNMNIVFLCGGTDTYANKYMNSTISKEKTGIYYLNTDKIPKNVNWKKLYENGEYDKVINKNTLVNLATFDKVSIGDPSLLSGFMNLSTDLFPAKNYGLVMWNHGGGVIDGICSPDNNYLKDNKGFDTNDLESALRSSNLVKNGGKLGMVAFDACLMGCSEVAYNLHNYYNYMFASEEIELGDFDYARMFKTMDSQLGKGTATDYSMIKAIHDNFSYKTKDDESHTAPEYYQQTGGVYDATASEKFVKALNNMGKRLNQLIKVAPNDGTDVLNTLAIARMKCDTLYIDNNATWGYTDPKYADIGELTYYLKSDLTALKEQAVNAGESEAYINAIQKSIDSISALQKTGCLVMSSTWYNQNKVRSYTGKQATSIEAMQKKAPVADFWTKAQGTAASYGTSVYFPVVFNNSKDETLGKYSSFYKGTALSDYSALMTKMIKWKQSAAYTAQKKALFKELEGLRKFASAEVEDYGDKTSPQYLVVKFRETYGQENAPTDSFGSPMYDALITMSGNPCVYAAYSVSDAKGNTITNYKRVALKNDISGEHFNLADSSMNIQLNTLIGYGVYQEGTTEKNSLDFKVLSDAEDDKDWKKQILTAVNNDFANDDPDMYKIVYGTADATSQVYHVFRQIANNSNVFEYAGTSDYATQEDGSNIYFAVKKARKVSFYDHYLHTTEDNSTELVCSYNHKFSENVDAPAQYQTAKKGSPIYLKKFNMGIDQDAMTFNPNDFTFSASIDFSHKDENGKYVSKADFTGECTTTAAWNANAEANSETTDDENTITDENTSADENTTADENENADSKEAVDENTSADENTTAEQDSGTEYEASEAPVITEEAA